MFRFARMKEIFKGQACSEKEFWHIVKKYVNVIANVWLVGMSQVLRMQVSG